MIGIAIGGGMGAVCRYLLGKWISEKNGFSFPIGTFVINGLGSFLIGFLFTLSLSEEWWNLLAIGFLGGFTTFSTFGYETVQLLEEQKYGYMIFYIVGTVVSCLCFTWLGINL